MLTEGCCTGDSDHVIRYDHCYSITVISTLSINIYPGDVITELIVTGNVITVNLCALVVGEMESSFVTMTTILHQLIVLLSQWLMERLAFTKLDHF